MTFDIRLLDNLDYDDAEPLLHDYIEGLISQFAESPEGEAYAQDHAEFGGWIGTFTEIAYLYDGFTLSKMTKNDVATVMEHQLPRKVTLLDPSEAEDAIPELVAFWNFLKREYKLRSAGAIAKYLASIESKFAHWMFDPSRGGIAKNFLMQGMQAGFDMTTQEGLEAFQQQYNEQIQETGTPPPGFPTLAGLPMPAAPGQNPLAAYPIPEGIPPEFVALLSQQFGFGPVPGLEHLPSDPNQLAEAIAQHLVNSGEVILQGDLEAEEEGFSFTEAFQADMLERAVEDLQEGLSEEVIDQLQQLTITPTEPGTIVQDFDTLLEAIGDRGLPVSGKLHHFTLKILEDLNRRLSQPIEIAMQRPQQKTYSNLHGLYLLLRVTGIAELSSEGKTTYLKRNPDVFAAWQTLNPTEKYFNLLEAWLIRADPELLGDRRDFMKEGTRVLRSWPDLMKKSQTYKNYNEQDMLSYWPGLHNLALMKMFGWVEVQSGKPEAGRGWRIKKIAQLPVGHAMAAVALNGFYHQGFRWVTEQDYRQPWGELQPYFQPYFPEWQNSLPAYPAPGHRMGTYIFKSSLGKIWRRLAISSEATLEDLGDLIRASVDFDSDHLDRFSYKDPVGRTVDIDHPFLDGRGIAFTDEVAVGDLPLKPGMTMTYLFDFGDRWEFDVVLEEIQPDLPPHTDGEVLEQHGKAPEQYPDLG